MRRVFSLIPEKGDRVRRGKGWNVEGDSIRSARKKYRIVSKGGIRERGGGEIFGGESGKGDCALRKKYLQREEGALSNEGHIPSRTMTSA